MQAIQSVISFMQNLGAACMMPIFVFIIGLVVRVPLKQLLKASVTVGCGFIGTFMVMDLLAKYIGADCTCAGRSAFFTPFSSAAKSRYSATVISG